MPVYLDHAATTPVLPEAIEAYTRALTEVGNPSSIHSAGQSAKRALEDEVERLDRIDLIALDRARRLHPFAHAVGGELLLQEGVEVGLVGDHRNAGGVTLLARAEVCQAA